MPTSKLDFSVGPHRAYAFAPSLRAPYKTPQTCNMCGGVCNLTCSAPTVQPATWRPYHIECVPQQNQQNKVTHTHTHTRANTQHVSHVLGPTKTKHKLRISDNFGPSAAPVCVCVCPLRPCDACVLVLASMAFIRQSDTLLNAHTLSSITLAQVRQQLCAPLADKSRQTIRSVHLLFQFHANVECSSGTHTHTKKLPP